MKKDQFEKIMKETRAIKEDVQMNDEMAFDTAEFILASNPGLKEYIQKVIGAWDAQGWLANEI